MKETRRVHYSSNISLEKLIMEQLLEGPESKNARSAIPSGTKLVSVSLVDGVCYVSFDENFKNQDYSVNEAIVIYSIVDSLSELSSISKVQISVNGIPAVYIGIVSNLQICMTGIWIISPKQRKRIQRL